MRKPQDWGQPCPNPDCSHYRLMHRGNMSAIATYMRGSGILQEIPGVADCVNRDCLREPSWRFTLCPASSMPSNNAKRLLSCCFMVSEHL